MGNSRSTSGIRDCVLGDGCDDLAVQKRPAESERVVRILLPWPAIECLERFWAGEYGFADCCTVHSRGGLRLAPRFQLVLLCFKL